MGIDRDAGPHAQPQVRPGSRCDGVEQRRQPLELAQVVDHDDARLAHGCSQVSVTLVDAVHQDGGAIYPCGGGNAQFAAAGAVQPEPLLLRPLRCGDAEKGLARQRDAGRAGIVRGQAAAVLVDVAVHGGLVIDIERRAELVSQGSQ